MSRTLAQLRTGALRRADMVNSRFVDATLGSEVDDYINNAISDLYDLIVGVQGQEWYQREATVPTVAGTATINMPSDFYLLTLVEVEVGGERFPLRPYMPQERNRSTRRYLATSWPLDVRYRLQGDTDADGAYTATMRFDPTPGTVYNVYLTYTPKCPVLNEDTDVWDGFNGWEEFVETDAAIRLLAKEDSDTSALMMRREGLRKRILALAPVRDQTWPERIVDVEDY